MSKLLIIAARCIRDICNRPTMDEIVYELENCYVQRAKYCIWAKFIRRIIILKSDQKFANRKRCHQGLSFNIILVLILQTKSIT